VEPRATEPARMCFSRRLPVGISSHSAFTACTAFVLTSPTLLPPRHSVCAETPLVVPTRIMTAPIHGNYHECVDSPAGLTLVMTTDVTHSYYSKRAYTAQEPRLALLPDGLLHGKRVLDIGCNQGWVTCEIGMCLSSLACIASSLSYMRASTVVRSVHRCRRRPRRDTHLSSLEATSARLESPTAPNFRTFSS
jgi:hypothetical protein